MDPFKKPMPKGLLLLARNGDQLNLKLKGGVRGNHASCATGTVGNGRRTGQFGLAANLHQLNTLGPTSDHTIQWEINGLISLVRAVKLLAIGKSASVMHFDFVCRQGTGALTILKRAIHQTRSRHFRTGLFGGCLGKVALCPNR